MHRIIDETKKRDARASCGIARGTAIKSLAVGIFVASVGWQLTGTAGAATQPGWRWCHKCQGMFYARAGAVYGVCPAGAAHSDAGSGHYFAVFGEDVPGQQGRWRWCHKCEGFFYARAGAVYGVCPAGATHSADGSGHYAAIFGGSMPGEQQGGWAWCHQCEGMFYCAGNAGQGVCPAGGTHSTIGSGQYAFRWAP
jgi:hypothetical protein